MEARAGCRYHTGTPGGDKQGEPWGLSPSHQDLSEETGHGHAAMPSAGRARLEGRAGVCGVGVRRSELTSPLPSPQRRPTASCDSTIDGHRTRHGIGHQRHNINVSATPRALGG